MRKPNPITTCTRKEFLEPETYKLRHLVLKIPQDADDKKKDEILKRAQEIRGRIVGGEDFAKVAQEVSEDEATKEKGGDLGFAKPGSLSPSLEQAVSKLEVGAVFGANPFRTGIRSDQAGRNKAGEKQLAYETVKENIVSKLLEDQAKKKVVSDADAFYEQVYRSEDLEGPAEKFGFPLHTAESVTKLGGIPELPNEPKIGAEAFEIKPGEISHLIRSGDHFVIFKV